MNFLHSHEIKAHYAQTNFVRTQEDVEHYLRTYILQQPSDRTLRLQINKLKQIMSYFFKGTDNLLALRQTVLTGNYENANEFLERVLELIRVA